MGQPITLYDLDGKPVTVYGKAQADVLLAEGYSTSAPPVSEEMDVTEPVSEKHAVPVAEKPQAGKRPARIGNP